MTPTQFIAQLIEPPVAHDLIHLGLFITSLITSLALGGILYLLTLITPGIRL